MPHIHLDFHALGREAENLVLEQVGNAVSGEDKRNAAADALVKAVDHLDLVGPALEPALLAIVRALSHALIQAAYDRLHAAGKV